jgi:hypothetical protein
LKRVAAPLALHIAMSEATEFFVNDRHQGVERALIAIAPSTEDRADILCTQLFSPIPHHTPSSGRDYTAARA